MHSYKAHGLSITSEIVFPELLETQESSDITIKYGEVDYSSKKVISKGIFRIASHYVLTEESIFLIWNGIDICEINYNEIRVNPRTNVEKNFLRALILGPAMGILLHQRGRLVLHASAVNINEGGVAFIGDNGAGKSTTTVSFMNRGYPLITDDILSIEFVEGVPLVFPGFPRIKLWPETIEKNMGSFTIHSDSRKRSCTVDNFHDQTIELKHIYVIKNSEKTFLETISPQESLIELIRNSYCANIFQNSDQTTNLGEYAKIVKQVSMKQLLIEKDLDKIPEMVLMVEQDVLF